MIRGATARLLLLTLPLLFLAGCWDARELNHLALVMAVGVDRDREDPSRFLVTIQVARPGSARAEEAGGGGKEPVYTVSASGDTIFTAIRNLAQFTSRRIMWAHNNVVVIGEPLAREDITPVIDFFTRNQELRMRTWVVVAQGTTAQEIVAAKTGMEEIPANSLSAVMRYAHLPGETLRTDMGDLLHAFLGGDVNPVISAVRLSPRAAASGTQDEKGLGLQVELRGNAIFSGPRLVGFLDKDKGRGLLWLRNRMENAVISVPCPSNGSPIALELRSSKVRIRPILEGNNPVVDLTVRTDAWIAECPAGRDDAMEAKLRMAKAAETDIREAIEATLAALQEDLKTDAITYGEHFHAAYPAWWRANRDRWSEIFPTIRTNVNVTVHLGKMGLFARPMKPEFTR